jgi:prepilin-type N-terminal cleavage/methylation domain-containing protein
MPTSSVGTVSNVGQTPRSAAGGPGAGGRIVGSRGTRGVTLIEMLIVVTLIALIAGLSYPSLASGLDSLRLRSASDSVAGFLTTALDRADRRQQAVEIVISPRENAMTARTADLGFVRRLEVPDPVRIVAVTPPVPGAIAPDAPRRFLVYPGGSVPRIGVEIASDRGHRRLVSVDPISGIARAEVVTP